MRERFDPTVIPAAARSICDALRERGHGAWVVGGCVRDHLLGRDVADWDICTSARPEEVVDAFRKVIPTGIAHGTVTVVRDGAHYEVTTLRGEGAYTDGRRPDAVSFLRDVREDLARRDFTVNAIAYDPVAEALVDPFDGLGDLRRRVLRAVGDPAKRFGEDGLRVLRGARFVASLEFTLDPDTEAAIPGAMGVFRKVSAERVREEWMKTLRATTPSRAFEVMRAGGIIEVVLPTLLGDGWAAAVARMDAAPQGDPVLRLAALLLGLAPDDVLAWMKRYRFSTDETKRVTHLVGLFPWAWPDDAAGRRRALVRAERRSIDDVVALLDAAGDSATARAMASFAADESPRIPFTPGELALDGNAVMGALGIGPSRLLGDKLKALHAAAVDDPSVNTREGLLALLKA
ncbi:MAG: CCA tRNA nucleotidyltransferase [Polyangiales bacterium]